jgi:N-methylhydantoinase B
VWADPGRPVTLCTSHPSNEIVEAIVKALAGSCPHRVMAGWGRRFRIAIKGEDPRTGRSFMWHLFHARPGGGASPGGDGWSSIGEWHSVGGLKFGSVEVAEARFPLHFRQHEFLPNSGGDGQFRGGLGVALDLVFEIDKPALGNTAGEGTRHGACGMLGGEDGQPHRYRLLSEGRPARVLRTKETGIEIRPGDCLEVRSGGGGGWGPPARRSQEARRRDAAQGLVRGDEAREPSR